MDQQHFDALARAVGRAASRRRLLGALLGGPLLAVTPSPARARHHRRPKRCPAARECAGACCANGTFCCDPAAKTCCPTGAACCNAGSGQGSCCTAPNVCADPYGNDAAPSACCPPDRTWTSDVGISRCCPAGTRAMPNGGASSNGGPCCPNAASCAGHCCADGASCVNNQCCSGNQVCAGACCADGSVCCNGHCELASRNPHPCGSTGCCFGTEVCCQGPYNPEPGCVPAGSC